MEQQGAIPPGYMTVGEAARKMNVTVRTLQHYDREGLLSPSAVSAGGRRLYTDRDIVRLHQILSLKHLGFSLSDIRDRLIPLDSPSEVAQALSDQAELIRERIDELNGALADIEVLRREVLSMQSVDFSKYADIIVNLQMKNEFYWMIKYFDDDTLEQVRSRFDKDSSREFIDRFHALQEKASRLREAGTAPDSDEGICFAEEYWNILLEFTGGDMSMLPVLSEMSENTDLGRERTEKQAQAESFIEDALGAYFERNGLDQAGVVHERRN